jgi:hypothetical protein
MVCGPYGVGAAPDQGWGLFLLDRVNTLLSASSSFPCSFPPVLVFTHVTLDLTAMDAGLTALECPRLLVHGTGQIVYGQ